MRTVLIAALLVASSLQQAVAAPKSLTQVFGFACYGRVYDQAHLASHPRQQVVSIVVRDSVVPAGKLPGIAALVDIRLTLRRGDVAEAVGYCKYSAGGLACRLEGDAGTVRISRRPGYGIVAAVGDRFDVETGRGFYDLAKGDDRDFLLTSQSACR
jgi:hypothetical protein